MPSPYYISYIINLIQYLLILLNKILLYTQWLVYLHGVCNALTLLLYRKIQLLSYGYLNSAGSKQRHLGKVLTTRPIVGTETDEPSVACPCYMDHQVCKITHLPKVSLFFYRAILKTMLLMKAQCK